MLNRQSFQFVVHQSTTDRTSTNTYYSNTKLHALEAVYDLRTDCKSKVCLSFKVGSCTKLYYVPTTKAMWGTQDRESTRLFTEEIIMPTRCNA